MSRSKEIILERLKSKIHDANQVDDISINTLNGWSKEEMIQKLSEKLKLSKAEKINIAPRF